MASVSLFWTDRGADLHLLAGETSPSLLDVLGIEQQDGTGDLASTPPADMDAATLRFEPNFTSLVAPPFNAGITVDTSTGVVTVEQNRPPRPRLDRFVIEASVRTKGPQPRLLGPISIRVHVYDSITELWLTPSTLSVRRGTAGTRFTVMARFDDDSIGDVTGRPGIQWSHTDPVEPNDPRIRVHPTTGALVSTDDAATVTITAKHAGLAATATAQGAPNWSQPVEVVLLRAYSAGVHRMAEVPNVLFLGEGFEAVQRAEYLDLVRKIVDMIRDPATQLRPFDLPGIVNYWVAFMPSRGRGTSPLYDMDVVQGQTLRGEEIPLPERPLAGNPLTLENLIYAVGLPTTADQTVTHPVKLAQWLFQYGPSVATNVTAAVLAQWLRLHRHRLADEVDSAFGIAMGSRPQMHLPIVHRAPDLNPRRVSAVHLEALFANMFCQTAIAAPTIGSIWADPKGGAPSPADPGLPAGLTTGQNRGLVFFLLGGARSGGAQPSYAIVGSLVENSEVNLVAVAGSRRIAVAPHALPATPPLRAVARFVHEGAHALGLRDEYGEPHFPLVIPADKTDDMDLMGNVQPATDLATAPNDPRLDPARLIHIKWLWPRVSAAGLLTALPAPAGGAFIVRLRRGHAAQFRKNDVVKLRKRNLLPRTAESVRLTVTTRPDMARDEITVRPVTAAPAFLPAAWPAGSMLIRPVRGQATAGDPLGPDLILDHLAQSRLPLNRTRPPAGQPAPVCVRDQTPVQTPSPIVLVPGPPGRRLKRPTSAQHVIGVYDGGFRYFCGVYHPAGECLMRQLTSSGGNPTVYPFCWVCAYFLIDRLDPTKHAVVERTFAGRYPRI